jgi:L-threonylcarbamoyladenylate synthase
MDAVAALRAGQLVLLPTDGVYGLCCAVDETAARALYALKRRDARQPTAVIGASIDALLTLVPELDREAILTGPFTTVLANPSRRLPFLGGGETIGVRIPDLPAATQAVLDAIGAVVATSANEPGEPAAASLDEVPQRIRAACGAEIDAGRLSGAASTVVDMTGETPVVLRQGAGELR